MYNAKPYKSDSLKKSLPLLSFVSILFASFLLSGSAKIGSGDGRVTADSPLAAVRVTCRFENVEIGEILRKISIDHGVKIRAGVEVSGRASVNLISVSLNEAMTAIFKDSAYGYRIEKDAVVIENKRGGAFSISGDRMGFKRVMIAPAFAGISEVRRIVESMRSADASVVCDEKSGVLVLDERPETADRIIAEINRIDTAETETAPGGEGASLRPPLQTRLFVLKNADLREAFAGIEKHLSKRGNACPNYDLNSVIVTDEPEALSRVAERVAVAENANGTPIVNCRFYKVPRAIVEDLAGIGYCEARSGEPFETGLSVVKNKSHFFSILEKYLKNSSSLSCGTGDHAEIKTLHRSIGSRFIIKPYIGGESGYRVRVSLKETAQAFNETINCRNASYEFDLKENDVIIARGFEKTFADVINQTCVREFLSFLPSLRGVNESVAATANAGHETAEGVAAGAQEEYILMALELSSAKNAAGIPAYSFVNLLHLDSNGGYANLAGGENFSSDKSYLNIFSAPAGAENFIQRPEPEAEDTPAGKAEADRGKESDREGNNKRLFKITAKKEGITAEKVSRRNGVEKSDIVENKNLIIEEHGEKLELSLKLKKNANGSPEAPGKTVSEKEALDEIRHYVNLGMHERARAYAAGYLAVNPDAVNVRIALGSVYKEMKLFVSAREELKKALKHDSGNKKIAGNIEKLDSLISLIQEEKVKLLGKPESAELDLYLR